MYAGLEFAHFFMQPMDGPDAQEAVQAAIRYCAEHPQVAAESADA